MNYILLLRGINVGGKNSIKMSVLKEQLTNLGFSKVITYINSGNIIFRTDKPIQEVKFLISQLLAEYPFEIKFVLLTEENYRAMARTLPAWWSEGKLARRDVLFLSDELNVNEVVEQIKQMNLNNELLHFMPQAIFWGKVDERLFHKTAYHRELIKTPMYKQITIRNGNTFERILSLLEE